MMSLGRNPSSERIGESHETVDDDKGNPETSAERDDLLTDRVTKGGGAVRLLVHDFGHGCIGNNIAGPLDELSIQVADERRLNVLIKRMVSLNCKNKRLKKRTYLFEDQTRALYWYSWRPRQQRLVSR